MYTDLWKSIHSAVACVTLLRGGDRLSSGTGFKVGSRLITNNHVVHIPGTTHVAIKFVSEDGISGSVEHTFTLPEFEARLLEGDDETAWDYAIYDIDKTPFSNRPSLEIGDSGSLPVGCSVALFGFQFEQQNLSVHAGILSSQYLLARVKYLQLDASVNHGNSGGPLIEPASRKVVGIVTRKATGLTRQFDQLIESFEQNAKSLEGAKTIMKIGGVDPIEVFKITQRQFGGLALEIKRSANVGIGYAYAIDKVAEALERNQ